MVVKSSVCDSVSIRRCLLVVTEFNLKERRSLCFDIESLMRFSRFETVEKIGGKTRREIDVGGSYEQALGRQATQLSSYSSPTRNKITLLVSKMMSQLI